MPTLDPRYTTEARDELAEALQAELQPVLDRRGLGVPDLSHDLATAVLRLVLCRPELVRLVLSGG